MVPADDGRGRIEHVDFEQAAAAAASSIGDETEQMTVSLAVALSRAVGRFERDLDREVCRPRGVSLSTYRVLFSLHAMGSLRPGELAEIIGLAPGTVTSILTRSEKDGLLVRERAERSRRETVVRLTDEGRRFTVAALEASTARQRKWLAAFTWGEAVELLRLLHRFIDHDPDAIEGDEDHGTATEN